MARGPRMRGPYVSAGSKAGKEIPRAAHVRPAVRHAKLLQFLNQSHGSHMCDPYATLASCSTSSSAERRQEWPAATARPRRAMS